MFPRTGTKSDINQKVSCHVETIVLLGGKNYNGKINITVNTDELENLSYKATTAEIKEYIKQEFNLNVTSAYIGQVKGKLGIREHENYRPAEEGKRKPSPCPQNKEEAIIAALKHFNVI